MKDLSTVLVIDDDADIRELMRIALERVGYRVKVAADGDDALSQMQEGVIPAVILLDMMMPRMDGEQFLKQMCSAGFAEIPIVILSGDVSAAHKANEFQVKGYLMKPVEFKDLLETVNRFAQPHSQQDAA